MKRAFRGQKRAAAPKQNPESATQEYVFALLQTFEAEERGFRPGVPDISLRPTYRWSSHATFTAATVLNAYTTTWDLLLYAIPAGVAHIYYSTAFSAASGKLTAATGYADASYSTWATNFDAVRMVACQFRVRNITAVTSQAGQAQQGANLFGNMTNYTFAQFSNSSESCTRTLASPGDVGVVTWVPVFDQYTGDTEFIFPSTAAANTSTAAWTWIQTPVAGQQFSVEIITMWEALVIPNVQSIIEPTMLLNDPMEAQALLYKAFKNQPAYSLERTVIKDDGVVESTIADLRSIWGGVKSAIGLGKRVSSWISSGWNSMFGVGEKLMRYVSVMEDDCVSTLLSLARDSKSTDQFRNAVRELFMEECKEGRYRRPFEATELISASAGR